MTPDSFSDGGRYDTPERALMHVDTLVAAGATMVDVGGESTRPGAEPVDVDEERRRILPVVEQIAARGDVLVSVDTRRSEVARDALAAGAHVVNDVGGLGDPAMRAVCAAAGAPAIAMHMQGDPATMQRAPAYDDVVAEVAAFLRERAAAADLDGVPTTVVDPGWGFGKSEAHNVALLRALSVFGADGRPVAFGASRKGTLGRWTGVTDASRRDAASLVVHMEAVKRGATMLRVHDVAGHAQGLAVAAALDRHGATAGAPTVVRLTGLAFHGRHGVFAEEHAFGARFVVDVAMELDAVPRDDLTATVDYGAVLDAARVEVAERSYALIERLADAIAVRVLALDGRIAGVTVTVHKPHAPLPGIFGDVEAEVERRR